MAKPIFDPNQFQLFYALRQKLAESYGLKDFQSDILSGCIVALVAIPLGMALSIAIGVAPQNGLYTVIIAGFFVALFGGSRVQVTGPTAAFIVILVPIVHDHGLAGLLMAGMLSGIILMAMGLARLGSLIEFIPYPVTTGFTSGIAVVIAVLQIKDFLGLPIAQLPSSFFGKLHLLLENIHSVSWTEFAVALLSLIGLLGFPKITRKIPAPIVILILISVLVFVSEQMFPGIKIETIGTRFQYEFAGVIGNGIPAAAPRFQLPWQLGEISFSFEMLQDLLPSAFAIAMLGAIESLLSAVVADGMIQKKHNPNSELFALGVGNLLCPFFGGIPATGAIARTVTNIRYGARSPISSMVHSLVTLLVIIFFAPIVSHLPIAALAALLLVVAYNMSEYRHFIHILKVAPRTDILVLLVCFSLTVVFDMVIGVGVGMVLAAFLFMQRMSKLTTTEILSSQKNSFPDQSSQAISSHYICYRIEGPLFFGAAEKAVKALSETNSLKLPVALILDRVPMMDMTALVALESTILKLRNSKKLVYLVGLQSQPRKLIQKSDLISKDPEILFFSSMSELENHFEAA